MKNPKLVLLAGQFDRNLRNLVWESLRELVDTAGDVHLATHIMSVSLATALCSVKTAVDTPDALRELIEATLEATENGAPNEHDRTH